MSSPVGRWLATLLLLVFCLDFGWTPSTLRAQSAERSTREATLLFNTASRLYRQENWKDAAASFDTFLSRFPKHADAREAHFARGYARFRLGEHGAAAKDLERCLQGRPAKWSADAHLYLGKCLEVLGKKAPSGDPSRLAALRRAGREYVAAAEVWLAARRASAADTRTLLESEVSARTAAGEVLYHAGDHQRALEALGTLADDEGSYGRAKSYRRALYFAALSRYALESRAAAGGKASWAGTLETLARITGAAYQRDPLWPEAAFLHARLLHSRGESAAARALYSKIIETAGRGKSEPSAARVAESRYWMAQSWYAEQRPDALKQAARGFRTFLQAHADHGLAERAALYEGLCQFDAGEYQQASRTLTRALGETDPIDTKGNEEAPGDADSLLGLRIQALLCCGQSLVLESRPRPELALSFLKRGERLSRARLGVEDRAATRPPVGHYRELLGQCLYWSGEAQVSLETPQRAAAAASAFEEASRLLAELRPTLAEESLYKQADALFRAASHLACAEALARYRSTYPAEKARYLAWSFALSAENALAAPEGELPAAERGRAGEYFAKAARSAGSKEEAARWWYRSGLVAYGAERWTDAAAAFSSARDVASAETLAGGELAELRFYLADAWLRSEDGGSEQELAARRWRLLQVPRLLEEYLSSAGGQKKKGPSKGGRARHASSAVLDLGLVYRELGDAARAKAALKRFLKHWGDDELAADVRLSIADIDLESGDLAAAARSYREAAAAISAPELAGETWLQAGRIDAQEGRHEQAAKAYALAAEKLRQAGREESAASARFQEALARTQVDAARGLATLRRVVDEFPRSPEAADARTRLGYAALDGDRPSEALEFVEPLIASAKRAEERQGTRRDEALYISAWARRALAEKLDEASDGVARRRLLEAMEDDYRRLISEHADSELVGEARVELAQALFNRGEHSAAKPFFAAALAQASTKNGESEDAAGDARGAALVVQSHFGLASVGFELEDFASAREHFDRVAETAEGELASEALFRAARSWMRSGKDREAAERYRRLLGGKVALRAERLGEVTLHLAECLHRLGEYEECVRVLEGFLGKHAESRLRHRARFQLGFALQFLDRSEKAIEAYRRVVQETGSAVAARAQYHIGECYMDTGDHRRAAREFLGVPAAFEAKGVWAEWCRRALLAAGIAYQAAGDAISARQQWDELVDRHATTPEGRAAKERLAGLPKSDPDPADKEDS